MIKEFAKNQDYTLKGMLWLGSIMFMALTMSSVIVFIHFG